MVSPALLERALLLGAHAAERPVDVHTAVAARAAVCVRGAVLVLDESQTLALFALLGDALEVGRTVTARVEQLLEAEHRHTVLLGLSILYLRIIIIYKMFIVKYLWKR